MSFGQFDHGWDIKAHRNYGSEGSADGILLVSPRLVLDHEMRPRSPLVLAVIEYGDSTTGTQPRHNDTS